MTDIFFDAKNVPPAENEYVLWLDIMGTKNIMSTSVLTSTIFICKLHVAILEHMKDDMKIYPMMDGAYVTAKKPETMEKFVNEVFSDIADSFIKNTENKHRFLVKGALAYGPVVHGESIDKKSSSIFETHDTYLHSVLFGMPMIQANVGEKFAPPFGVYCDESARMANSKFSHVWYKCIKDEDKRNKLLEALNAYFSYARSHSYELEYSEEKINEHNKKSEQYLKD